MSELRASRPAPRTVPPRPPWARYLPLIALAAAVAAASVGWFARGATAPEPPTPAAVATQPILAGPATVAVPGDWLPRVGAARVQGLDPESTATLQLTDALSAYAIATVAPISDPSLIPAPLRALLPDRLPRPRPTALAGVPAWRYGELPASGGRMMEVTVAPSTAGVVAVACIATREAWVEALGCGADVRRVAVASGDWVRPGPEVAFRATLPSALERLDAKRVAIRAKLRRAGSRRAQARLTGRLAEAYGRAVSTLAPVTAPGGKPAGVLAALRGSAAAHRHLSAAAAHGRPRRYRAARRAAERSDIALARALAKL